MGGCDSPPARPFGHIIYFDAGSASVGRCGTSRWTENRDSSRKRHPMAKMRATVFRGVNDIRLEEVERPRAGAGQAVIRITLTTICGTDLHIVRGEYRIKPGLII